MGMHHSGEGSGRKKVSIHKWFVIIIGQEINMQNMRTVQNLNSSGSNTNGIFSQLLMYLGKLRSNEDKNP